MEKSETTFTDLVTRYLSGEATAEDIGILSGWVKSDPEKAKEFASYSRAWALMAGQQVDKQVDADAEWENFKKLRTEKEESRSRSVYGFPLRRVFSIAALVILLLVPGWFIWRYVSSPEQILVTAGSGTLACNLPDGTVVTLNKGAVLEYPELFKGKNRTVKISGEACFEVSHDQSRPFVVQSGEARVEVLGTVFYVNAPKENEHISVILASGSVATYFRGESRHRVVLEPGEAAEISPATHTIEKHRADDPNLFAWKTRKMVFDNATLQEVIEVLNRVYGNRISLSDPAIANCRVTVTFADQTLESVLTVLRATLGVTTDFSSDGIIISGKACE